jgi:predicted MPP superfamily phosphohydrolase
VPTVIAHVSDFHFGAHDPAAADSLAGDVAAAGPALTVVTGDCTMRARRREFRQAAELLARLPAPRLVVLGNTTFRSCRWTGCCARTTGTGRTCAPTSIRWCRRPG